MYTDTFDRFTQKCSNNIQKWLGTHLENKLHCALNFMDMCGMFISVFG